MDLSTYANTTRVENVRTPSATLGAATWKSTFQGETESFDGYFIPTTPDVHLAVRSDDGVNLSKNGTALLSNLGTGQHWPADTSFKDLGGGWVQNTPYRLQISYSNPSFMGDDADGISLMAYNGTGKTVTVDLEVDGVGEDLEEKDGVFMGVSSPSATAATAGTSTDLKSATLKLKGQGETGTWSLAVPAGLKVWQQVGANWQLVTSGQQSAPVTLPATISLRVEGAQAGAQELTGNFQLTAPQAAQAIGDKAKITVVGVQIEKCSNTFVPRGGSQDNSVQLKATVTPNTLKGKFRFTLFEVSNEPGYCLNAPLTLPATGEDSATWKDLQFPDQTGFTLSGSNSVAETTANNLTEQIVTVKCTDYGAYGKLGVRFILPNNVELVAKEAGDTKGYTNIPLDDNDNHIADSMGQDNGPMPAIVVPGAPTTTFAADDDNDINPAGANVDGDGISRYEEYRGFMVQGAYTRLSTLKKDVFFCNVDVADAGSYGFFTEGNLTAPTHSVRVSEYIDSMMAPKYRVVNFNSGTAHATDQQAIRVTNGGSNGIIWGMSLASGPWVPNLQSYCYVYVDRVKSGTKISGVGGVTSSATTIPAANTSVYRRSGTLLVEDEQVTYTGVAGSSFTGCVRGANGTIPAPHANNVKINFFVSESDFLKRVLAHEAGHLIGLGDPHPPAADQNVMSDPTNAGTQLFDGFWSSFVGTNSSVTGNLRVKN